MTIIFGRLTTILEIARRVASGIDLVTRVGLIDLRTLLFHFDTFQPFFKFLTNAKHSFPFWSRHRHHHLPFVVTVMEVRGDDHSNGNSALLCGV